MKLKMLFFIIFLIGCGEDIKEEVIETYIDDSPKLIHVTLGEGEEKIIIRSDSTDAFDLKIGDEVNSEWKSEKMLAFDLDGKSLPLNK